MYNLIEYRNNYSKRSGCLRHYYRDETNANFIDSELSKSKVKRTGKNATGGNTKHVNLAVPLK